MFSIQTMRVNWNHKMRSWVFDNDAHGIKDEPFILGTSSRLTEMLKEISLTAHHTAVNNGFQLTISAHRIPNGYKATLIKEEDEGAWYRFDNGESGWLGPLMKIILKSFPIALYFTVEL